jgi:UDP-glucose 4-epimerase
MTWLVTGGAGYIGSHVVRAFGDAGIGAVVLDDLSSGHREFVEGSVPLVEGSVLDGALVERALREHDVTGVVHLAGFKYAGVSVRRPLHTYAQNVQGTATLLAAMDAVGVPAIVFSSSAAVYGTPEGDIVTEDSPTHPASPYGESKLVAEWVIRDVATARALDGGRLAFTALRYFNVVGSGAPDLYDTSPHNLFPLVLKALTEGRTPRINGVDYATPDGTCVRDYVHVQDLALAHVEAARVLADGRGLAPAYNLGSGDGLSVRQIMDSVARVTGVRFEPEIGPRRPGDPDRIVASGELAAADLGWRMRHDLDDMVATAWRAWQSSQQA